MAEITLEAQSRSQTGRHVHALRRDGFVPAVLYGHQVEARSIAADAKVLGRIWHRAGKTHLVDLVIDGGRAQKVLIRELQIDPRSNLPVHADFFAVNLKEKLTADVPVIIVGSAPAVDELKLGQLLQPLTSVKVECLPQDLPAQISVDVSGLTELEAHVLLGEITLPKGVALVHADPDEVVVKVSAMRVQQEEEEEGTQAPEGEAAAGAAAEGSAESAADSAE